MQHKFVAVQSVHRACDTSVQVLGKQVIRIINVWFQERLCKVSLGHSLIYSSWLGNRSSCYQTLDVFLFVHAFFQRSPNANHINSVICNQLLYTWIFFYVQYEGQCSCPGIIPSCTYCSMNRTTWASTLTHISLCRWTLQAWIGLKLGTRQRLGVLIPGSIDWS